MFGSKALRAEDFCLRCFLAEWALPRPAEPPKRPRTVLLATAISLLKKHRGFTGELQFESRLERLFRLGFFERTEDESREKGF
jgi:hypothetical protein